MLADADENGIEFTTIDVVHHCFRRQCLATEKKAWNESYSLTFLNHHYCSWRSTLTISLTIIIINIVEYRQHEQFLLSVLQFSHGPSDAQQWSTMIMPSEKSVDHRYSLWTIHDFFWMGQNPIWSTKLSLYLGVLTATIAPAPKKAKQTPKAPRLQGTGRPARPGAQRGGSSLYTTSEYIKCIYIYMYIYIYVKFFYR